jgi:hypothetical protein
MFSSLQDIDRCAAVSQNLRIGLRSESGLELPGDGIQIEAELMFPL